MPGWLIEIIIVILVGAAVFFCGWLRIQLHLKNWHLGAILLVGILVFILGSLFPGIFPLIFIGLVIFAFPLLAWGYQLMIRATNRWASNRTK